MAGILVGTISALLLIYLSPTFQVDALGRADAPVSLRNPGLVSIPLAFAAAIIVSLLTRDEVAERRFAEAERRIHLGVAAAPAAAGPPAASPAAAAAEGSPS